MTVNPHPSGPGSRSEALDVDEIFRKSEPVDDLSALAIPDFFASEVEFEDFQTWLRVQRDADVP